MKEKMQSYKNLIVWQRAMNLVISVYAVTSRFPKEELPPVVSEPNPLTSQTRRAIVSFVANSATGRNRSTKKDCIQFLYLACSFGAELETRLNIAKRLQCTDATEVRKAEMSLLEAMKMLSRMISKLRSSEAVS